MEISTKKKKKLDEFNEGALAVLTRSLDFSTFLSFFLPFLFIFFSFSLFFQEKRFVKPLYVQRWLVHRMTNRHRRYPALGKRLFMIRHHHCGQTSLWIGFTVGNGVRSPRRASNRQSGPERLLLPFPIGSFFSFSRAPLTLTLSLFFFASLLFRGIDRCVTHYTFVCYAVFEEVYDDEQRGRIGFSSWYKFVERDFLFLNFWTSSK